MTHDASISVVEGDKIVFAAQSERYSKVKFDGDLHPDLIMEAMSHGQPDEIVFYENPWKKKWRQFWTLDWGYAFDRGKLPKKYLRSFGLDRPVTCVDHHLSHAAGGYYTSPFDEATVVVIDALGESQTVTGWHAEGGQLALKFETRFPSSIGLLYSAFTKRCGLKPTDEEYILMGMAAYGQPRYVAEIYADFIGDKPWLLKRPVHYGVADWMPDADPLDLAASIQKVCEDQVVAVVTEVVGMTGCKNLVYMGGVALNCVCNSRLAELGLNDIWIMPNPGDAGSSLGAAAARAGRKLDWTGPYLGTNIPGSYPVGPLLDRLLRDGIVGVANGRAEFGPRALGNRSLLADPRSWAMKDRVNDIKRRQKFRPFAPVVMEDHAREWFDMPVSSAPYMQFTAACKRPEAVPAICHADNSARVQTVSPSDHPGLYELLEKFYDRTGCPMLLNTSLNVRGRPMVNDSRDAEEFSDTYSVEVF